MSAVTPLQSLRCSSTAVCSNQAGDSKDPPTSIVGAERAPPPRLFPQKLESFLASFRPSRLRPPEPPVTRSSGTRSRMGPTEELELLSRHPISLYLSSGPGAFLPSCRSHFARSRPLAPHSSPNPPHFNLLWPDSTLDRLESNQEPNSSISSTMPSSFRRTPKSRKLC